MCGCISEYLAHLFHILWCHAINAATHNDSLLKEVVQVGCLDLNMSNAGVSLSQRAHAHYAHNRGTLIIVDINHHLLSAEGSTPYRIRTCMVIKHRRTDKRTHSKHNTV